MCSHKLNYSILLESLGKQVKAKYSESDKNVLPKPSFITDGGLVVVSSWVKCLAVNSERIYQIKGRKFIDILRFPPQNKQESAH